MRVRIIAATVALGVGIGLLASDPAVAATGSFGYVLRGDVAGEVFDPADGSCIPFDKDIVKIVNDTDRILHLGQSCDADAVPAGQVRPGETYERPEGALAAHAVTPLEPGDLRAEPDAEPADAAQPAPSPLPDVELAAQPVPAGPAGAPST